MAPYQQFKLYLVDLLGLQREFYHIVLGFIIFLVFVYFSRNLWSWKLLIPPFVFAIILELLDLRDVWVYKGPYDALDSIRDIGITILCPVLLLFCMKMKKEEEEMIL